MKVLVYSTHGFEKNFLINANQNKHDLFFTTEQLNENTASLSNGFDAVLFIFCNDDSSVEVNRFSVAMTIDCLDSLPYYR